MGTIPIYFSSLRELLFRFRAWTLKTGGFPFSSPLSIINSIFDYSRSLFLPVFLRAVQPQQQQIELCLLALHPRDLRGIRRAYHRPPLYFHRRGFLLSFPPASSSTRYLNFHPRPFSFESNAISRFSDSSLLWFLLWNFATLCIIQFSFTVSVHRCKKKKKKTQTKVFFLVALG